MCGIAGIVGSSSNEDFSSVLKMCSLMTHRGPDANNICRYSHAILGHTRLSVIDLSTKAQQPMESKDGRYSLVFNGEIYNYKYLRKQLSADYNFATQSDSEVLLASFIKWGDKCLEYLDGMFAFCVYDTKDRTAFFARDRFGQKPLFYYEYSNYLVFGSEIKSILASGVKVDPNMSTWSRYLQYASYDDDSSTFFNNINQLRPGEMAYWRQGEGLTLKTYYSLSDQIKPSTASFETSCDDVKHLLVNSCKYHMNSDVPVGISLSGGLDSSALLGCLELSDHLPKDISCISVDFGGDFSEKTWINAAANYHGLNPSIQNFSPDEFHSYIRPMMWHLEAPLGGLMNCALTKVMKKASNNQIVVMQDGSGLDEAFGGYQNHHNIYLAELFKKSDPNSEIELKNYAKYWGLNIEKARHLINSEINNTVTSIDGTVPVRPDLLNPSFITTYDTKLNSNNMLSTGDPVRDAFIEYLQVSKIPRNMRMKDRTSMAFGVELRSPFLDHHIIEYALNLPSSFHFRDGMSKSVIREALSGSMENSVRLAPKRSIQAPQGLWLGKKPMKEYVYNLINSESFADRGIFDTTKVAKSFNEFCNGQYTNSFFVWQWINMEEWFRMFVDGNPIKNKLSLT